MADFAESNDGLVHLVSAANSEYTVCGDAWEGFSDDDGDWSDEIPTAWKDTKKRTVTCPKCAAVVRDCRGVRTTTDPGQQAIPPAYTEHIGRQLLMGNYLKQLYAMVEDGTIPRGKVYDVVISHDDDCPLLSQSGECNCSPDFHDGITGKQYPAPAPSGKRSE